MNHLSLLAPPRYRSTLFALAISVIATASGFSAPGADGYDWRPMNSGTTRALHQISVIDNDFAVASGTHGTLLAYTDGQWSPLPDWSTQSPFAVDSWPLYVTALSPENIWIGAYGSAYNRLSRWNGTSYTSSTVTGVRTSYMANVDGILLAARGENYVSISTNSMAPTPTFTNVKLPNATAGQIVISVGGSSESNLWAVNPYEAFRSTNAGASWTKIGAPAGLAGGETLRAMAVSSSATTWLGTSAGRVFSWKEETNFSGEVLDLGFFIRDIYARDDQNIWFAGDGGNLWYYNGTTTSKIDLATTNSLLSITGTADGVWVSGAGGVIYSTIPEPSVAAISAIGFCCFAGYRLIRAR